MKNTIAIVVFLFILNQAQAQKPYILKSSKVTISGTSSLHDWTEEATKVEWKGLLSVENNKIKSIKEVVVTLPVVSIKSDKGNTMNEKTYEAFVSDKNPNIIYKLETVTVTDTALKATGTLTMAGTTNKITMDLSGKVLADGSVQLTGSQKLNMTEYKMKPPKAVMGTIKVGPEVTINYDLVIIPKP